MRHVGKVTAIVMLGLASISSLTETAVAVSAVVAPCSATSVAITEYNVNVATGKVQELFWIRNVSAQSCSLRGFVRVTYIGTYAPRPTVTAPHRLVVKETDSTTPWGGEPGGLRHGLAVPTVVLSPQEGVASFWISGTDGSFHQPNGRMSRCIMSYTMHVQLPGKRAALTVVPMHAANFDWCGSVGLTPILAGRSGADPALPLSRLGFPFPRT